MKPILSTILLAAGALLTLSGCSDEPAGTTDYTKPVGQQTFMDIDLRSAPDSRAYEFADGSEEEHRVYCARFYFFDEEGLYYGQASKWTPDGATEPDNVEHMGRTTVVLDNVGSNKYPTYLLTVLNAPDFTPKTTLDETSKTLMYLSTTIEDKKYYVMSTSSFRGTPKTDPQHYGDKKYYYATKLDPTDFKLSATDATTNPVVVYVERLAAKVELKMNAKANDAGVFPLHVSVMGNPNESIGDDVASTQVGVKILGWDFVDAKKKPYLSKQLDDSWTADADVPFAGWTAPDRYRSFWAKTADYGVDGTSALNKKTYDGLTRQLEDVNTVYTYEYTNERAKITKTTAAEGTNVIVGRTPHILVKALLTDHSGKPLDVVRYNGYLFTFDRFKRYILSTIDSGSGALNVYTKNREGEYEQLSPTAHYGLFLASYAAELHESFKKVVEDYKIAGTGKVMVLPKFNESTQYYTKNAEGKMEAITVAQAKEILYPLLAAAQTQKAEAYNKGLMYYAITIDHNPDFEDSQDGKYGIVRNHWYEITINSVANIGHGVFDGHHEIVEPDEPEDDKFFLAARIKVLSWRIVDKVVDL